MEVRSPSAASRATHSVLIGEQPARYIGPASADLFRDGRECNNTVGDRRAGTEVSIRMFLVAAKDQHVTGSQFPRGSRHAQLHFSDFARQILARSRRVWDPYHVGSGWKLHSIDLQSRDRLGQ